MKTSMSIRSKMDGGKFFNRIQSGSFNHRCMAAALRVQYGPQWIAQVWKALFHSVGKTLDIYANRRKRKHTLDSARKVLQKYKKQRLLSKSCVPQQDSSYGDAPTEPDISINELRRLSHEYLACLNISEQQQQAIAIRTSEQAADPTGEWARERHGCLTASQFGEICKRRATFGPLTIRIIYKQPQLIAAMRYGTLNEKHVREQYLRNIP